MTLMIAALLLLSIPSLDAQSASDPTGHWEGTIRAQGLEVNIQADFVKNAAGDVTGTMTLPAENIKGLPLKVTIDGRSINFQARADQPVSGTLSEDGRSIAATFRIQGQSIPFAMVRTGKPRLEPVIRMSPIAKELEGTWNGTAEVDDTQLSLVLTLANQPDGSATGMMVSDREGGLQVPVSAITLEGPKLTLEFRIVGAVYAGTLNAGGSELSGTYTRRGVEMPVTFRRAPR